MKYIRFGGLVVLIFLLAACNAPTPTATGNLETEANYWRQLGSSVATGTRASLAQTSSGIPVVAYYALDNFTNIYVKRWNGSSWVQVGGTLNIDFNRNAERPSLALDSSGNPVVSWSESGITPTGITSYNIYVKRWNGSTWVQLGPTFLDVNTNKDAFESSLALDNSGNPVVSWYESDGTSTNIYVKRWTGSSWTQVTLNAVDKTLSRNAERPWLVLKSDNNPIISWDEEDGTSENVYVRQF